MVKRAQDTENSERDTAALLLELESLRQRYDEVALSNSYRIGRKITYPARTAKRLKHLLGKRYVMTRNILRVKRIISGAYGFKFTWDLQRPRVALVVRSIEHPTSSTFIRMISPLKALQLKDSSYSVELVDGDRPAIARSAKDVIVQRTALIDLDAAKSVVRAVEHNKARLFIDTDDAFDTLDPSHPQYELQKDRIEALNYVLREADVVWVSTEKLQQSYKAYNAKLVRNTVDELVWTKLRDDRLAVPTNDAPLEIVYMGTKTHDGDFGLVLPALKLLHEKHPGKFRLHVIGVASLNEELPWLVVHHPPDGLYPNFVRWFSELGPFDIGISPLEDTEFNANKSDIKCLDYLAIGVKPVVSNVLAYENPELNKHIVRVDNTTEAWLEALEKELKMLSAGRKNSGKRIHSGYEYIRKCRTPKDAAATMTESLKSSKGK